MPTGAMTGMRSEFEITSTMCGLTSSGSPTKPMSTAFMMFDSGSGISVICVRDHQVGILAADADGLAALAVDGGDDLLVDGAGEHHLDDLDGRLVRDAQSVHELRT